MKYRIERPVTFERRIPMTYEEWLTELDEDLHTEWVKGEAIVFRPRWTREALVVGFLMGLVGAYVQRRGLGQVLMAMFEMRLETIPSSREPDIVFVANEHLDRFTEERLAGPADLVIEATSHDSVVRDTVEKVEEYAAAGVREYWVVEGRQGFGGATMHVLEGERYEAVTPDADGRLHSKVLEGLWVDPAWFDGDELSDPVALAFEMMPGEWERLMRSIGR